MKAKLINGQLQYFQPVYVVGDVHITAGIFGYKDIVYPQYNSTTQSFGSPIDMGEYITFDVIEKTQEEIDREIGMTASTQIAELTTDTVKKLMQNQVGALPDEDQIAFVSIFDEWTIKAYAAGDKFSYNGKLYKVIQAHTSQADWLPDATPALYVEIAPPNTIPTWKQPTGAHDAYALGDKVRYPDADSPIYESMIEANVYSPDAYPAGWKLVE